MIVILFHCFFLFSLSFTPLIVLPHSWRCVTHYPARACAVNTTVQRLWTAVHQLHQRETSTILQSPYVRTRTRGVQEGGHRLGIHWLRHGLGRLYRTDWEGTPCNFHKDEIPNETIEEPTTWPMEMVTDVCRELLTKTKNKPKTKGIITPSTGRQWWSGRLLARFLVYACRRLDAYSTLVVVLDAVYRCCP